MDSLLGTDGQSDITDDIGKRVREVRAQVAAALERAGRAPSAVRLVAVTKSADEQVLAPLLRNGCSDFAENRWPDARAKLTYTREHLRESVCWHFIGRLQLNKVKYVVPNFDWVHSVDSLSLAAAISERACAQGREINALVQVNVSGEQSKAGFAPEDVRLFLRQARDLGGVKWRGLMTMAPHVEDMQETRPWFRTLHDILEETRQSLSWPDLQELSMGMSNDFPIAIEEGATMVRVGRRLVGERSQQQNL